MKKIKLILLFIICFLFYQDVHAEYFQCNAFGADVYFDTQIAHIVRYIVLILQILTPIILVIMGSIDLIRGITSQKEDEIKKGQQIFIKRLINALIIFFVIAFVKLIISVAAGKNGNNIFGCVNKFIKDPYYDESNK